MTRATITIHQTGGEPVVMGVQVTDPDKPVVIEITDTDVKIHTTDEPRITT